MGNFVTGTCVKTEKRHYYINGDKCYIVPTKRVFDSWRFPYVVKATEKDMAKYLRMGKVGFRPGSFVKNFSTGEMYLIAGAERRRIESPEVLIKYGFKRRKPQLVSQSEINLHKEGDPIEWQ